jgi:hypothetical protein
MRPGIGRGGRGESHGALTGDGDEGNRADFKGQRSPAVWSGSSRVVARAAARQDGGASRARRRSRARAHARAAQPPFYGARAGHAWPGTAAAQGLLLPGPDGLWRAGRSGLDRAMGSAQSGRIGYFRIYF